MGWISKAKAAEISAGVDGAMDRQDAQRAEAVQKAAEQAQEQARIDADHDRPAVWRSR